MDNHNKKYLMYGAMLAARNAALGCIILAFTENLYIAFNSLQLGLIQIFRLDVSYLAFTFITSFLLTLFPSLIVGYLLAKQLHVFFDKGMLTVGKGFLLGAVMGGLTGFGVAFFILTLSWVFVTVSGKGTLRFLIPEGIGAVFLALLLGGWTGKILTSRVTSASK